MNEVCGNETCPFDVIFEFGVSWCRRCRLFAETVRQLDMAKLEYDDMANEETWCKHPDAVPMATGQVLTLWVGDNPLPPIEQRWCRDCYCIVGEPVAPAPPEQERK